ncbi:OprD family porin [Sulfurimonas sediminis]|uniref:OprD family porin n=1 Tax=Sulfurimonas sediminis TaxID=2590020 RepID=A0A7M1B487_9BACT|nr:OprD family outer membrane porin [Sulfurimonas sediminis]QOP44541.1 OprD family porin [Sulfurimonas sediminis]
MKTELKKSIVVLMTCASVSQINAAEVTIDGYRGGNIELQLKAMTVLSDNKNNFGPSNGSGFLVKLKYETPEIFDNIKVGVASYTNGDGGLTTWDERAAPEYNKGAYGMVVSPDGKEKTLLGEAYINYKNSYIKLKLGRQQLKTPLTVIKTSLMPNFYEAYILESEITQGLKFTGGHINKISFGSRAMADWGVIGEKTGTAGVGLGGSGVLFEQAGGDLEQAKFYNIGTAAGKTSTNGRSIVALTYTGIHNFQANFWIYHSWDIATDYYTELQYTLGIKKGIKLKLSAQYLAQKDTGTALAGARDFNLYGFKAFVGNKKIGMYIALNQSGKKDSDPINQEGQYFNAWGADPAYTSSIFSRNAYREDVTAYKIGGHYTIFKGLKIMMSYANYGQSLTSAGNSPSPSFVSQNNAYELDTVLVYKPNRKWMFKVFNAKRLSEYDGVAYPTVLNREMDHYRFITSYIF